MNERLTWSGSTRMRREKAAESIRMALCEGGRPDLADLIRVQGDPPRVTAPRLPGLFEADAEAAYYRAVIVLRRSRGKKLSCFDCWAEARRTRSDDPVRLCDHAV
jgi:hypothetical protein